MPEIVEKMGEMGVIYGRLPDSPSVSPFYGRKNRIATPESSCHLSPR
jgi:hypothetical protein